MKTTVFAAIMALFLISCKKDSFTIPDVTPQAELNAAIFPSVIQPRTATLGDSSSIFTVGELMTIFVQYDINRDQLTTAKLVLKDENGEVMNIFDMSNSTDLTAWDIDVPIQLMGSNFVFATINLEEMYAGKLISIEAQISGNHKVSDAKLNNAFTVEY